MEDSDPEAPRPVSSRSVPGKYMEPLIRPHGHSHSHSLSTNFEFALPGTPAQSQGKRRAAVHRKDPNGPAYHVMIAGVIMASENQQLKLDEVYQALERDYPEFKIDEHAEDPIAEEHWQSSWRNSVRHNLSGRYVQLSYCCWSSAC
jgi:hypothetical protein